MHENTDGDTAAAPGRLRVSRIILLSALIPPIGVLFSRDNSVASGFFREQDGPVLLVLVAALFAMTFRIPALRLPEWNLRWRHVIPAAALLVLLLWWGTYTVMANFAVTRDEHMVLFDMAIFAKGHLAEPLAPEWRPFAKALVPDFALEVPGSAALLSSYLPGNAMMRLAFSQVADPALMNPVLVGISVLAMFDIARRLFPGDRATVLVTMLLYVMSTQVLANAMTVYAMTGHTTLNVIWLALFLRDRPWAHALAMAISVLACGLHQLVFHPLFAGPFLLWRLWQGRYALFAAYTMVFATALFTYTLYPGIAIRSLGIEGSSGAAEPLYFWRDRVLPLFLDPNRGTVLAAVVNLIRYATWQNLALTPLAFAAWPIIRRRTGIVAPLAGGVAVTFAFCILVLAFQGHGWGYRYFCGIIVNVVLLAAFGYHHWSAKKRASADGLFVSLSLLTVLAGAFLLVRSHDFIQPYVHVDRFMTAAKSDMVLLDTEEPRAAIDLARNRPDLRNRPLLLSSYDLDAAGLAELCSRGTIAVVTRGDMQALGFARGLPSRNRGFERKVAAALEGKPCFVQPNGAPVPLRAVPPAAGAGAVVPGR